MVSNSIDSESQAEEEETLQADLTELLGKEEAARLMAVSHRPLAGLIDLSLIVKHVRNRYTHNITDIVCNTMYLWCLVRASRRSRCSVASDCSVAAERGVRGVSTGAGQSGCQGVRPVRAGADRHIQRPGVASLSESPITSTCRIGFVSFTLRPCLVHINFKCLYILYELTVLLIGQIRSNWRHRILGLAWFAQIHV